MEGTMKTVRTTMALLAGSSLLLVGCAAPPEAPTVDIAAEKAAVEQVVQDQVTASSQPGEAGADGYVASATDDIVWLQPNGERLDGKDAVRAMALQFTSAEDWSLSGATNKVVVAASADMAWAVGTYQLSLKDPEGNTITDEGKWLDTFQKQPDGTWKISAIAYNSDLPVAGSPAAATGSSS
jgi:ketosteroid isomerase-like protein